jgi:hypothetical protein
VITLNGQALPIPSPTYPLRHARWAYVPRLVGDEYRTASLVVLQQRPSPGTRVPAYGVKSADGYSPTNVDVTVAAR